MLILTLVALCLGIQQELSEIPSRSELRKAERTLKGIYAQKYEEKDAKALLKEALNTKDVIAKYVLLKDAMGLATEIASVETAFEAGLAIETHYKGYDSRWLLKVLKDSARSARTQDQARTLHFGCMSLARARAQEGDFPNAEAIVKEALRLAKTLRSEVLSTRASQMSQRIKDLRREAERVDRARKALAEDPDNTAASLDLGLYLCFSQDDWKTGLELIVNGEDPTLGKAARAEIQNDALAAADAWERAAKKTGLSELERRRYVSRAVHWLKSAAKDSSGVERAKVNVRTDALEARARLTVDLLEMVKPVEDTVQGAWRRIENGITGNMGRDQRIKVPYAPPVEYDLKAIVQKSGGRHTFFVGLPVPGGHVLVAFDDTLSGDVTSISGYSEKKQAKIFDAEPRTLEFLVRRSSVTVVVDGETVLSWKGAKADPNILSSRTVPGHPGFYWGTWQSYYLLRNLELRPISGQGRRLR